MDILATILSDVGKRNNRTLSREEMFKMLNDSISLLIHVIKLTRFRKLNMKRSLTDFLKNSLQIRLLCNKMQNKR